MTVVGKVEEDKAQQKKHFEIFVGDIKETWDRNDVLAKEIIAEAGFKEPTKFVLEALDKRGGSPVVEFLPEATVDLSEHDRKFFRVTPGGGGRS